MTPPPPAFSSSNFWSRQGHSLLLLAPLVLLAHLLLLGGRKVLLDVKGLTDLLGCLALDHVGHRLAGELQQALDVQIVGGQDELEQSALIDLQEVGVPGDDVVGALLLALIVLRRLGIVLVVMGPGEHLAQDRRVHIGKGHNGVLVVLHAAILQHGLDGAGALGDLDVRVEDLLIRRLQLDAGHFAWFFWEARNG